MITATILRLVPTRSGAERAFVRTSTRRLAAERPHAPSCTIAARVAVLLRRRRTSLARRVARMERERRLAAHAAAKATTPTARLKLAPASPPTRHPRPRQQHRERVATAKHTARGDGDPEPPAAAIADFVSTLRRVLVSQALAELGISKVNP